MDEYVEKSFEIILKYGSSEKYKIQKRSFILFWKDELLFRDDFEPVLAVFDSEYFALDYFVNKYSQRKEKYSWCEVMRGEL